MKVKIDDGRGWVFMRDDGKVFDASGTEIKWVPIGDLKQPSGFTWKPIDEIHKEIKWKPIGEDVPIEEPTMNETNDEQSKATPKEAKNGSAK